MRIALECGGFVEAADACHTANHVCALLTESLAGKLGGTAGMAGDDATSIEFATSYDAGAREALGALTDLTHAFVGLGRLLVATGANHASAEAAAAGLRTNAYVGEGVDDAWLRVAPPPPPSSLGRDDPDLGPVEAWILDQVEGFVWPGADVSLLRDAALAWQRTALSVSDLTTRLDIVESLLERQESPEIPVALAAVTSLRQLVVDTADQLVALGRACDDHAASVEDAHGRTRALLVEIGQVLVEGVAISLIVAGVTGGSGAGASAGAVLVRIRAHAPRFHALLAGLRSSAAARAVRLRAARDSLRTTRAELERFLRVPARDERGSMKHPLGWGRDRSPGWLRGHEVPPGHTIGKHVGKSIDELVERCRTEGITRASSFSSQAIAERLIDDVLRTHCTRIRAWVRSGRDDKLELDMSFPDATGLSANAQGTTTPTTGVRVVLIPRENRPDGWQILTAFPR